jgi:hypothetical protein
MTTTHYVYRNAHDAPTTHEIADDTLLDDACDIILAAMQIDPAACEYDCISDHETIVFHADDCFVIADDALPAIMLDDIYH